MKKSIFWAAILVLGVVPSLTGCRSVSRLMDSSGTLFDVEIVTAESNSADDVDRAIKILQSRIDAIGLDAEVERSKSGENRVAVKIFGSRDLDPLRTFLFTNHRLELKAVVSPPNPSPVKTFPAKEKAQETAVNGQEAFPYAERNNSTAQQFVILQKEPIVTGEHIRAAQAVSMAGSDLDYQISFSLNQDGAAKFGAWTEKNINNYLAVVLDDKVQSIAYIKSRISDNGEINGNFSKAFAEEIALSLSSGYIDTAYKIIEERPFN